MDTGVLTSVWNLFRCCREFDVLSRAFAMLLHASPVWQNEIAASCRTVICDAEWASELSSFFFFTCILCLTLQLGHTCCLFGFLIYSDWYYKSKSNCDNTERIQPRNLTVDCPPINTLFWCIKDTHTHKRSKFEICSNKGSSRQAVAIRRGGEKKNKENGKESC